MPAAKPAALKLLNGRGDGKDAAGRPVVQHEFRRIAPTPPEWLCAEARAEWDRVVPGLTRLQLLKEEDRAALAAYCDAWATFVAATRQVAEQGLTIEAKQGLLPHPAVGIARNAGRELRSWANHFGLSPSAEGQLKGGLRGDDAAQESNPFAG